MQFGQLAQLAQQRQTMIKTSKGETSSGLIRGSMDAGGMSLERSTKCQMSNKQLYDISKEARNLHTGPRMCQNKRHQEEEMICMRASCACLYECF